VEPHRIVIQLGQSPSEEQARAVLLKNVSTERAYPSLRAAPLRIEDATHAVLTVVRVFYTGSGTADRTGHSRPDDTAPDTQAIAASLLQGQKPAPTYAVDSATVVYQTCESCSGRGSTWCWQCRGTGTVPSSVVSGECPACYGWQQVFIPSPPAVTAQWIPCPRCGAVGTIQTGIPAHYCTLCAGSGHARCLRCEGHGGMWHWVENVTTWRVDPANIHSPPKPPIPLRKFAPKRFGPSEAVIVPAGLSREMHLAFDDALAKRAVGEAARGWHIDVWQIARVDWLEQGKPTHAFLVGDEPAVYAPHWRWHRFRRRFR
jgi:hypothetical protein